MFIKTVFPSALGFRELPFSDAVDAALEAGFSGYWFNPYSDFTIPAEDTLGIIQTKHILPMGMELPVEFRSDDDRFYSDLAKLDDIASYASRIGIRRAVTWIVPFHDSLSFSKNFRLHTDRLRLILDVLSSHSIALGLEFQGPRSLRRGAKHWFVHSLDGIMSLIAAIDRPGCGVLMDIWHWSLSGMTSFDFGQFEDASQIVAVHLNDAPSGVSEDDYQDLCRRLPGATGILDSRSFMQGLSDIGYCGPVIAEPFDSSLEGLSPRDAFTIVSRSLDEVLLQG